MTARVLTVGHGRLDLEGLWSLLEQHKVDVMLDVRSQPGSTRAPEMNARSLEAFLRARDAAYKWVPALGGRPSKHLLTGSGAPDYERMVEEPSAQEALDEVASLARAQRVVLLCSESRPEGCHRSRMLAPALERRGVQVEHILHSGELSATPTLFA